MTLDSPFDVPMKRFFEAVLKDPNVIKDVRSTALNTKIFKMTGKITVDTCNTIDFGWETCVIHGKDCTVVEAYDNQQQALDGHNRWVNDLRKNPKMQLNECRSMNEYLFGYDVERNERGR